MTPIGHHPEENVAPSFSGGVDSNVVWKSTRLVPIGIKLKLKGPRRNPWVSTPGHLSADRDKQVESVSPSFPSDSS